MKPDLDAIRARCAAATPGPWRLFLSRGDTTDEGLVSAEQLNSSRMTYHTTKRDHVAQGPRTTYSYALADAEFICFAKTDIPALLAYIEELERRVTYTVGETEWAQRIATLEHMLAEERENVDTLRREIEHGNQRFVDEYDAHQETRTLLTDLYMKQLRADAAQMREYGISYAGLRQILAEYDGGDLSIGKVLDLVRAAARELAKEEVAELKARITTLEAMR